MKDHPPQWNLARVLSHRGWWSRRAAVALVRAGKVSVCGRVMDEASALVSPKAHIVVSGLTLPGLGTVCLWRYHKACGLLVSHRDSQGRRTIFDVLPSCLRKEAGRLRTVGRLDRNSEGLLLLTNDGALKRFLELPRSGILRKYRVRVQGLPRESDLLRLSRGLCVEGTRYRSVRTRLLRCGRSNAWLEMQLSEGRNREIRKLCGFFGWRVNRLIRTHYGPWHLGSLRIGEAASARLQDLSHVPPTILRERS